MSRTDRPSLDPSQLPRSWVAGAALVSILLGGGGATLGGLVGHDSRPLLEELRSDVAKIAAGSSVTESRLSRVEADVTKLRSELDEAEGRARDDVRKIERTLAAICAALPRARCPQ